MSEAEKKKAKYEKKPWIGLFFVLLIEVMVCLGLGFIVGSGKGGRAYTMLRAKQVELEEYKKVTRVIAKTMSKDSYQRWMLLCLVAGDSPAQVINGEE